ncbi:PAS domain-containing protein [Thalassobaculum sp. OXR-137]|uniref:PAS domain-containing protein n=1 Tax=Thalassobaculum sp. OXR-137 TaxID=3100173 RepID=UPI002AC9F05A|nr:PAS domain-containing protein [Thalassobaculum sp. OXR-137]WPZ32503.1 PAS domain-containing protein [Thalassobaculum sp. OXR-137]
MPTPIDGWWQVDHTNTLQSPELQRLLQLWESRGGALGVPKRDDFSAEELMGFGGRVVLLDVEPAPFRLRFRLLGVHVTEAVGRDATGRYLDEVYDTIYWARLCQHFQQVVDGRRPLRMFGHMAHSHKPYVAAESIDMPLIGVEGTVAMILQGFNFEI